MVSARRFKLFLGLSVLALVVASGAFLVENPGRKSVPPPVKAVDVEQAEVVIDGFDFSSSEMDGAEWSLTAVKAEVSKETGVARLHDLEAVINAKDGTVLTLKAQDGTFDTVSKAMELKGGDKDIAITSNRGYEMSFRDLRWDDNTRELSTDNRVTIDGKNMSLEGKGMVARADMQEVRIIDGVKTVFRTSR